MFSSVMRAQISLSWVIGPPVAFALALGFGFPVMYLTAAVVFLLCGALVTFLLPSMPKSALQKNTTLTSPRQNRHNTLLLFFACTASGPVTGVYLITMPLYVVNALGLSEKLAGIMMGTAARLEISVMLIAGYVAKRVGKRILMRSAIGAGLLFYVGLVLFSAEWLLLGLQLLNTIFIGILAGIGMLYFQDLMPGRGHCHHAIYQHHARRLDHFRIVGRHRGTILGLSRRLLFFPSDERGSGLLYVEN